MNDHLLPLANECVPELGQLQVDQASLITIAQRLSAWRHFALRKDVVLEWHVHALAVECNDGSTTALRVLLPSQLRQPVVVRLYWNRAITYTATLSCLPAEDWVSRSGRSRADMAAALRVTFTGT